MNKKSFCYLPFGHVLLKTKGTVGVCCHYKPQLKDQTFKTNIDGIEGWWNSEELHQLRQQFLAGEKPAGCSFCYEMEDRGFESIRTRTLEEFKLYRPSLDNPKIIAVS